MDEVLANGGAIRVGDVPRKAGNDLIIDLVLPQIA